MKDKREAYYAGKGCKCGAYGYSECGCGVDWTDAEVYTLREEVKDWKENFKNMMIERDDYIKKLTATMGKVRIVLSSRTQHFEVIIDKALAILNEAEGE